MSEAAPGDRRRFWLAVAVIVAFGLFLRLKGIHNPIVDHPGWRQGDTAAIARNFATLEFNPFRPQTDYDGPPPNYVELELQIVPFLAATLYKIFGVHEIFGRLISIGFSLATVVACGLFARWAFASDIAGVVAAFAFASYPGSTYYGRTFTPDTTMVFFLTAAVYASLRWIVDDDARFGRRFALAAALAALAVLAKPVALVEVFPIAAALLVRRGIAGTLRNPATYAFFALALLPYAAYDAYVRSIAEWHWASGITTLHVLPELSASFASGGAWGAKVAAFWAALGMLAATMLGPVGTATAVFAIVNPVRGKVRTALWAWLAGALLYAFVVVTVERVDYYLYLFLPLAAVWTGGFAALAHRVLKVRPLQIAAAVAGCGFAIAAVVTARAAVADYYKYRSVVYVRAKTLDKTLAPGALIVMGHYDPSVLYYIGRKGWEEDPKGWTPFDEESAIKKGARYFVAVEPAGLKSNRDLYEWLKRFPLSDPKAAWPVYETDPAKTLPGAEDRWNEYRSGVIRARIEVGASPQPAGPSTPGP